MSGMATILAPHPDDELIGCYSWLAQRRVAEVIYFEDCTEARMEEACAAASYFGFAPIFTSVESCAGLLNQIDTDVVLLPSRHDSHPHHKAVNKLRRAFDPKRLKFYSVDLQTAAHKVRAPSTKREALDRLYPSQKALWDANASYYLFEAIVSSDITRWQGANLTVAGVPVRVDYTGEVFVAALADMANRAYSFDDFMNQLAATVDEFEVSHEWAYKTVSYRS